MIHNSIFRRKTSLKKILILGSGALQIGQAGEFDYSGSQAIKALKEEGIKSILINPNIATIQTSKDFADEVYFLPVQPHFVEEVIKKEKPDGIFLSFGGQTALNCGLELYKSGVLKKYNVKVLGSPISSIRTTEDRKLFAEMLTHIKLSIPKSAAAKTIKDAQKAGGDIGFPQIIRSAFSLGGQDSQVCWNRQELTEVARRSLSKSPQILIEEYLNGFKEIEYEVVRDKNDNCITVCNMENIDPMGIHTGESIVVAPSQTLNNFEYHTLRQIAIKVIRHLKIVGECNIQFALNPRPNPTLLTPGVKSGRRPKNTPGVYSPAILDYRIIEVNARLSRSSALASKATGYPLAYVAAKLALGHSLTEIKNSVTQKTIACFEPALDYIVLKFPRWDLDKFIKSQTQIGPAMQSVGEVMAIGRKFEEVLQKATRMLDIGMEGPLDEKISDANYAIPTPNRIFAVAKKIKKGTPIETIHKATGIDPFFLYKIKNITDMEKSIQSSYSSSEHSESRSSRQARTIINADTLLAAKQLGFSDKRIAKLTKSKPEKIYNLRQEYGIHPSIKQIDTLAAEYPAQTNYLYLTYNGNRDDVENSKFEIRNSQNKKVLVLGSGPYRIGSSVEFDWCCVTCAKTAAKNGYQTIIVNCNPETVSTDFDMADKLYFDELTAETILEIWNKEKPLGAILSMGGQTPNNLATILAQKGITVLGTSPASIDQAEDRNKFSKLCDKLHIDQPAWAKLKTIKDALKFAKKLGYPVLVRPSYVLSGAAMNVAFNPRDLKSYLTAATQISNEYPVVISQFHQNAKEIEIDAVAGNGEVLTYAICEHIENAGVHSGDSTMVLPTQKVNEETKNQIVKIAILLAKHLKITGPYNIQFLAKDNKVMVIECNLRASRSLPFVSKVTGTNFVKLATEAILNKTRVTSEPRARSDAVNGSKYVGVKAPQFSFARVKGADPILRVEMSSTGEVACFGKDVYEAFLKSQIATGMRLPEKSVYISLSDESKPKFLESAKFLKDLGLTIYATRGTSAFLKANGIKNQMLYKIHEEKRPTVIDYLVSKKIDLVINVFDQYAKEDTGDGYLIRRATIDFGIPIITNIQNADLFVKSLSMKKLGDLQILPWSRIVTHKN